MTDGISRRGFLGTLLAAAAALGIGRPSPGYAIGSAEKWIPAGKSSDYAVGEAKLLKDEKLYIIKTETGFQSMSAKCTHFGCAVERQANGTYVCPCHDSAFDATGKVTRGPARKALVWYQTREDSGSVFVNVKGIIEPK